MFNMFIPWRNTPLSSAQDICNNLFNSYNQEFCVEFIYLNKVCIYFIFNYTNIKELFTRNMINSKTNFKIIYTLCIFIW